MISRALPPGVSGARVARLEQYVRAGLIVLRPGISGCRVGISPMRESREAQNMFWNDAYMVCELCESMEYEQVMHG